MSHAFPTDSSSTATPLAPARREAARGASEQALVCPAAAGDDLPSLWARARTAVPAGRTPLVAFLFGRLGALRRLPQLAADAAISPACPCIAVEGSPCHDGALAGIQLYTAAAAAVTPLRHEGRVIGSVYHDGAARHVLVAGLEPVHPDAAPEVQAREIFDALAHVLASAGFELRDLVRTWFFNRRILEWYQAFNHVRRGRYAPVTFRTGVVPASTGIEGIPLSGAALGCAAWAVQPEAGAGVTLGGVPSPLQGPAAHYGSLFSRATEIVGAGRRRIWVSGTASIGRDGESRWAHDLGRQIAQTMEVVEAILATRDSSLADVDRATAYFKRGSSPEPFTAWLQTHGREKLPFLALACDVCRDELLFEIELDAVRTAAPATAPSG